MTALLILSNLATAMIAVVYYVRYHWADDELTIAHRALETNIQKLARSHQYQQQVRDFYQHQQEIECNSTSQSPEHPSHKDQ